MNIDNLNKWAAEFMEPNPEFPTLQPFAESPDGWCIREKILGEEIWRANPEKLACSSLDLAAEVRERVIAEVGWRRYVLALEAVVKKRGDLAVSDRLTYLCIIATAPQIVEACMEAIK